LRASSLSEPMAEIQAAPKRRNGRGVAPWRVLCALIARRRGGGQTDGEPERDGQHPRAHGAILAPTTGERIRKWPHLPHLTLPVGDE
jgi:hypothetical protein